MNRIEILIIKIFLWVLIPGLFFFLFWWASASLAIYQIYPISENQIALFSIAGLVIGLCVTFLFRNFLFSRFYNIGFLILGFIYLFCSTICFAIMMGFPAGNIILGGIAGFYIGRRLKHNRLIPIIYLWKTSIFTAVITGFWVLVISILAFMDGQVLTFIESNFGLVKEIMNGPVVIISIIFISVLAGLFQFYLTRFTGSLSLKL